MPWSMWATIQKLRMRSTCTAGRDEDRGGARPKLTGSQGVSKARSDADRGLHHWVGASKAVAGATFLAIDGRAVAPPTREKAAARTKFEGFTVRASFSSRPTRWALRRTSPGRWESLNRVLRLRPAPTSASGPTPRRWSGARSGSLRRRSCARPTARRRTTSGGRPRRCRRATPRRSTPGCRTDGRPPWRYADRPVRRSASIRGRGARASTRRPAARRPARRRRSARWETRARR